MDAIPYLTFFILFSSVAVVAWDAYATPSKAKQ